MLHWIGEQLPTILASLAVLALVALAIVSLYRDRKKGKCECGGNCGACAMCGSCHSCKK